MAKKITPLTHYLKKERRWYSTSDFLLVSGLGLGLIPFFPGFWGSVLGIALAMGFHQFLIAFGIDTAAQNWSYYLGLHCLVLSGLTLLGVFRCDAVAKKLAVPDHPHIVIDEVVGMWLALLFIMDLGFTTERVIAALLLFRILDMAKPGPIGRIDRWTKTQASSAQSASFFPSKYACITGWGVVLDDLLAGAIAGILIRGLGI